MKQIYRTTPMSKCDFNKVAKFNLQKFSQETLVVILVLLMATGKLANCIKKKNIFCNDA